MFNFLLSILAILLFFTAAFFFAKNDILVSINYLAGQIEVELNWVMLLCFICGLLLGLIIVGTSLLQTKFALKQARSRLERHQAELNSLRALPVKQDY